MERRAGIHDWLISPRDRCLQQRTQRRLRALGALGIVVLMTPLAASSHHSIFGRFDGEGSAEIEGKLVSGAWSNPHVTFKVARGIPHRFAA